VLQEVALGQKSLADYTHIAGKPLVERIRALAEKLEGQRVLHVSATAFGGGVSEILYTIVPLMRDVGLDAHWHVIFGKEEFFNATKLLHNSLQGAEETLSDEQWRVFDEINAINAEGLQGEWDTIIVHDPQPIGLRRGATDKSRNWIWRCHIDLSEPNPAPIARWCSRMPRCCPGVPCGAMSASAWNCTGGRGTASGNGLLVSFAWSVLKASPIITRINSPAGCASG